MEKAHKKVFLSWGLGTESTAILIRWCLSWILQKQLESTSGYFFARPLSELQSYAIDPGFEPSDLTVITAQLGSEHADTLEHCEQFVLPLLKHLQIRFIEVSRAGPKVEDGVAVLQDSLNPEKLHWNGVYRLYDELLNAGVLPSFAGDHLCASKNKGHVIEQVINYLCNSKDAKPERIKHVFGYNTNEGSRITKSESAFDSRNTANKPQTYRLVFGFNAQEERRIVKAKTYDVAEREGFYPLAADQWNWNRQDCVDFLWQAFAVFFGRSACIFCCFAKVDEERIIRLRKHADQAVEGLILEYGSLCMNHRGTLYQKQSFREVLEANGMDDVIASFEKQIETVEHGLYRVRRLYTAKGTADRCTERLAMGSREAMAAELDAMQTGDTSWLTQRGIRYLYVKTREENVYPTREEFFVVAPAWIEAKTRHGMPSFNHRWDAIDRPQLSLFAAPEPLPLHVAKYRAGKADRKEREEALLVKPKAKATYTKDGWDL